MKESVTIQYRCEDADTNLVETIPIASIGIDQWSQGHPVLFNLDRRGHHGRRMLSVLITACEAVLHEIEAQKQRDPSYIDSDLQWAWGRGYKAGASRGITEEEIAAAMAETRKFITLPGAWMENIIRIAFDAARRKAMEE